MILILSQDRWDITTEAVQDWIEYLGGECVRLNGEDLNQGEVVNLRLNRDGIGISLNIDGRSINLSEVGAVWGRRWHSFDNIKLGLNSGDPSLACEVRSHLIGELRTLTGALDVILCGFPSLSLLRQRQVNKLEVLNAAASTGLLIPETLVTTDKKEAKDFCERHGRIITKSMSDGRSFVRENESYAMYTVEVSLAVIDNLPDHFFPSMFQELLDKSFDVRIFYLAGKCYSMAIFSQLDSRTSIDFRHYNRKKPNRMVPYQLPVEVEEGVERLMSVLQMKTGSLDFVRTQEGAHVFLEVNPVGQFRMVSEPCNYLLEKRVAELLLELERDGRKKT